MGGITMRYAYYATLFILIFFVSAGDCGEFQEVDAPSAVSSVTVFLNKALVSREFIKSFEPGLYTVRFSQLPFSLEDDSIRVSGKGTAEAKILNVRTQEEFLAEAFRKEARKSAEEFDELRQEIGKWEDGVKTLQSRERFLLSLSEKTAEAITQTKEIKPPSLAEWEDMLDFLEKQLNALNVRKREAQVKLNTLRDQENRLRQELVSDQKGLMKMEKTILIDLEVLRRGDLRISASYIIPHASWVPVYDLRISTEKKDSILGYGALISQDTGEDWPGVDLTLSTAKPVFLGEFPEIEPAYLIVSSVEKGMIRGKVLFEDGVLAPGVTVSLSGESIQKKKFISNEEGYFEFANLPPGSYDIEAELEGFNKTIHKGVRVYGGKISELDITLPLATIREEITVTAQASLLDMKDLDPDELERMLFKDDIVREAEPEEAIITEHDISTSFDLKHKESVLSGKEPQKVFIAQQPVEVTLDHLVAPKISENTFLRARIKNLSNIPYIPGKISVFLEGTFVNSSHLPMVNPGERYELPVGIDDSVKVIRKSLTQVSKSRGIFKNKLQVMLGYAIIAENFKRDRVELTIIDQIPVSKSEEIEVEVDQITPQPIPEKASAEKGILRWKLELASGEKKTVEVRYRVIYPKNTRIEEYR
ncbi:MAG: mucoidy inhibitor MuiA family protein [Candidatus Aminicenantes bacterium]|nr:MAG: mucoidy inhibitor MuiA family protein [Candidatus Aminicenantes bacterium]